ncbi:MAG: glucosaminidase domain-containing protein [Nitrosopumilus sp.]|nr:glucosaminidase domain-containing protein [Nitrosopumilus sp.]
MKRSVTILILLIAAISINVKAKSQAILNYIDEYKWVAIQEMIDYKIPSSITLAQGILESGAGQSELAKKSNNHFGIKCHKDWKGDKVYYDDDEKDECFRKYDTPDDSYHDHSVFLSSHTRYSGLFELDIDNYKGWAKGLKKAGYATNPNYDDLLIGLIEEYKLYEYDQLSVADIKKADRKASKKNDDEDEKEIAENKTDAHFSWNGYDAEVFYFNRIPTIITQPGETPLLIAEKHKIKLQQLLKYNDINKNDALAAGIKFYLQPKRRKGKEKYHVVKSGETMWSISRDEGILLDKLYERNNLNKGQEPIPGEKLNLKGKRKSAPKTKGHLIDKRNQKEEVKKKNKKNVEQKENENGFMDWENETVIESGNTSTFPNKSNSNNTNNPTVGNPTNETPTVIAPELPAVKQIPVYHSVKAGETLYAISKKYNITVTEIQNWNSIIGTNFSISQKLIVGYSPNN